MSNESSASSRQEAAQTDWGMLNVERDEISLLDLAIVLAKHRKLVIGMPLIAAMIAAAISLLLPNIYTANVRILPPQQSASTASALLNQLGGGLGGLAGSIAGIKNPNDLYIGMLKSRVIAENLITRFGLEKVYDQKFKSDARQVLDASTMIFSGKDGIISIDVNDRDPKRAADIANAYVDELMKLTSVLAVTEASQRRLFFERQLAQAKASLIAAERATRSDLEKGGLANVDSQGRAMVELTARLRGQISVKEVQIGAMRAFATNLNPDLQKNQEELLALKRELARVEGTSSVTTLEPTNNGVSSGLDNLGRLREMKYYETIYDLLAKQYEVAKIDEAKDASIIQVLDKAIEPNRKSQPKRAIIVMVSFLVAAVLAIILAFIHEAIRRLKIDPRQSERLAILKSYSHIGRSTK